MKIVGITCSFDAGKLYLKRNYVKAVINLGFIPLIISPEMTDKILNYINEISALIISGGGDINPNFYGEKNRACKNFEPDERVLSEFKLIEAFIEKKKPILGICYGMQLMNVFLGGTLYQNIETEIKHTSGNHQIQVIDNFLINKGNYTVNSYHHQAIKTLGNRLEIFCIAEDRIIEGVYLKEYPFFVGVQWHPERHRGEISLSLWKSFAKSIK
ncbi:MAG: type 1 glutamine amidotransferase [Thermodesulfovibrio sp.]|nr:type 1 glutamine amidotransferase [Thermodesulfovibrio sp.]MDW7998911.1 type 1 glutamine amidotransferase [Thermodesulfovibrio sp.]